MKRRFLVLVVLAVVSAGVVFAAEISQPQLPVGFDKFELEGVFKLPCGDVNMLNYMENENTTWVVLFVNRSEFPNPAVLLKLAVNATTANWESWLDRNRDGEFDEYYPDGFKAEKKYQTICGVINWKEELK